MDTSIVVCKELPISVNSWRQHKNVFPLFPSSRGTEVCQYGRLQAVAPRISPCGEARGISRIALKETPTTAWTTPQVNSGKLVYAAEWMRNTKYLSGKRKQKKVKEEVIIFEKVEGGSHMMKKDGDRSSLRHGSVSDGVSSQCALGSAVLSSPDSWRPPPAPAWRPASVSWLHRPAPVSTQSADGTER